MTSIRTQARMFATIEAYWRDAAPFNAEIADNRAQVHAAIDKGMQRLNEAQRVRWEREEGL